MIFFRQAIRLECCNFKVAEAILKKEPVTEITQLVKTIQQFANYYQNSMGTQK